MSEEKMSLAETMRRRAASVRTVVETTWAGPNATKGQAPLITMRREDALAVAGLLDAAAGELVQRDETAAERTALIASITDEVTALRARIDVAEAALAGENDAARIAAAATDLFGLAEALRTSGGGRTAAEIDRIRERLLGTVERGALLEAESELARMRDLLSQRVAGESYSIVKPLRRALGWTESDPMDPDKVVEAAVAAIAMVAQAIAQAGYGAASVGALSEDVVLFVEEAVRSAIVRRDDCEVSTVEKVEAVIAEMRNALELGRRSWPVGPLDWRHVITGHHAPTVAAEPLIGEHNFRHHNVKVPIESGPEGARHIVIELGPVENVQVVQPIVPVGPLAGATVKTRKRR